MSHAARRTLLFPANAPPAPHSALRAVDGAAAGDDGVGPEAGSAPPGRGEPDAEEQAAPRLPARPAALGPGAPLSVLWFEPPGD